MAGGSSRFEVLSRGVVAPTEVIAQKGRLLGRGDIRLQGDGNVGSQNAARLFGLKVGVAVFFIDVAKGATAVAVAYSFNAGLSTVLWGGTLSVIGHKWPVFLGFRGGRGEATAVSVLSPVIHSNSLEGRPYRHVLMA